MVISHFLLSDALKLLIPVHVNASAEPSGDDDLEEECAATPCIIRKYKKKIIKWLNCDKCHLWFHGYCIKAKKKDYNANKWFCSACIS